MTREAIHPKLTWSLHSQNKREAPPLISSLWISFLLYYLCHLGWDSYRAWLVFQSPCVRANHVVRQWLCSVFPYAFITNLVQLSLTGCSHYFSVNFDPASPCFISSHGDDNSFSLCSSSSQSAFSLLMVLPWFFGWY